MYIYIYVIYIYIYIYIYIHVSKFPISLIHYFPYFDDIILIAKSLFKSPAFLLKLSMTNQRSKYLLKAEAENPNDHY